MRHTDILLDENQQQKQLNAIPNLVAIIGGALLVVNALYLGWWGIGVIREIFAISATVGLIMLLTAIGFIEFVPLGVGIASLSWFKSVPAQVSKLEYWSKVSLRFVAGLVSPYFLYIPATFATFIIAAFISSVVE